MVTDAISWVRIPGSWERADLSQMENESSQPRKPKKKGKKGRIARDLAEVRSPVHDEWRELKSLTSRVPVWDLWAGCMGIAMFADDPEDVNPMMLDDDTCLVRASAFSWLAMVSVPPGHWEGERNRGVRHTAVFKHSIEHGALKLSLDGSKLKWDHWRLPFDKLRRNGKVRVAGVHSPDALNSNYHPREFSIANAVLRSMVTQGRTFRRSWRKNYDGEPETGIYFGADKTCVDEVPHAAHSIPRPWVRLADGVTSEWLVEASMVKTIRGESLAPELQRRFVYALGNGLPISAPVNGTFVGTCDPPESHSGRKGLVWFLFEGEDKHVCVPSVKGHTTLHIDVGQTVRTGDEIGFMSRQLPQKWFDIRSDFSRYNRLSEFGISPETRQLMVELWLDQQIYYTPAGAFAPYCLVSAANTQNSGELVSGWYFNVATSVDCYNERLDAYIFPALRQRTWDDFTVDLLDIAVNLTPRDERFSLDKIKEKKVARKKAKVKEDPNPTENHAFVPKRRRRKKTGKGPDPCAKHDFVVERNEGETVVQTPTKKARVKV